MHMQRRLLRQLPAFDPNLKWFEIPWALGAWIVARFGVNEVVTFIAAIASAGLILVFGSIAEEVMEGDTHQIDMAILLAVRTPGGDLIGPAWFHEMMRDLTALGSYALIIMIVAAVVGYLLLVRKYSMSILVLAAVVGGTLISNLLKHGFDRPRPDFDNVPQVFSASFPSGHATLSAVTYLTLGGLLTRANVHWRVRLYFLGLAIALTLIVGISRVYLGVHYPSDVLAGWCIGASWALVCWAAAFWLQRRGKVESPASESPRDQ